MAELSTVVFQVHFCPAHKKKFLIPNPEFPGYFVVSTRKSTSTQKPAVAAADDFVWTIKIKAVEAPQGARFQVTIPDACALAPSSICNIHNATFKDVPFPMENDGFVQRGFCCRTNDTIFVQITTTAPVEDHKVVLMNEAREVEW